MAHLSIAIKTRLRAYAGLTALVAQRSFRGDAPARTEKPYVTFHQIDDDPAATLAGNSTLTSALIALMSVAVTDAAALAVAAQVKAALTSYAGTSGGVVIQRIYRTGGTDEGLDEDTRLYKIEQTYKVWYLDA
jgi:hypothetical protein